MNFLEINFPKYIAFDAIGGPELSYLADEKLISEITLTPAMQFLVGNNF